MRNESAFNPVRPRLAADARRLSPESWLWQLRAGKAAVLAGSAIIYLAAAQGAFAATSLATLAVSATVVRTCTTTAEEISGGNPTISISCSDGSNEDAATGFYDDRTHTLTIIYK